MERKDARWEEIEEANVERKQGDKVRRVLWDEK